MIVASPGFDNDTNKVVYFSNDGGLYRADDVTTVSPTSGWTNLNNNLGVTQFLGAAANSAGVIIGGSQDNGTPRYSPGASPPWTPGHGAFGGDGGFCAADPFDNNYFYGEYSNLSVYRSTNGATSGGYIYCNPVPTSANGGPCTGVGIMDAWNGANFVSPFILDPNDPNTMLAGGLSLWRSNDIKAAGLPTWTPIKAAVLNLSGNPNPISAIAVDSATSNLIVVGHNDGQIWITFNGLSVSPNPPNWTPIGYPVSANTPNRYVGRLTIDSTRSPHWIYATFGGFNSDNIYVTKNFGATWTQVTGACAPGVPCTTALPSVPIRSLIINPVRPDFLYVGTEIGMFASEDAGATWQLPQGGPANVSVDDLFWLNGDLIAVTHGRGLYTTHSSGPPVFDMPLCASPSDCPCFGYWDCPCTWPGNRIPSSTDDVNVGCPVTVRTGASARNMLVSNRLTLQNSNVGVTGTLINNGLITTDVGMTGGVGCHDLINNRPQNVISNRGVITVTAITASGDVTDGGIIALSDSLSCTNLTVAASDGMLGHDASLATNGSITVRGNIFNNGTINDNGSLSLDDGIPAVTTHTLTGTGQWNIGNTLSVAPNDIVQLANDMTFGGGSVRINSGATLKTQDHNLTINGPNFDNDKGTLDIGTGNLLFTGTNHFFASGSDGVGNLIGSVLGTGTITIQPSDGSASFGDNTQTQQFQPSLHIASGLVDTSAIFVGGKLTVDQPATLTSSQGTSIVNGDVLLNGVFTKNGITSTTFTFNGQTFTNNGSFFSDFVTFNNSGAPRTQSIAGNGVWPAGTSMAIGGGTGSTSTTTLLHNLTLNHNSFAVGTGCALNLQNFNLTYTGNSISYGGNITGTGVFKMSPNSGAANIIGAGSFSGTINSGLEIATGTVTATGSGGAPVGGPLVVDSGATLTASGNGIVVAGGNVTINGTLSNALNFTGNSIFTNNGLVTSIFLNMAPASFAAPPVTQQLGGAGTWTGATGRLYIDARSTVTLVSDMTYGGPLLYLDGRLNTDVYTFTLPCTTTWQGNGDIVGSIRRTNLSACGGAVAYGNPFTTISFTGGTPPTDVIVKVTLGPPAGFPNAVQRTYQITPIGGSGYTATLRLHYLDSELNGNNESTMQLYRNNGAAWTAQGATARDTTNNWVEYNNVTQFSPWTLASLTPPPTPTPGGTATPTPSPTPSPIPTPTPTGTPTPTPTASPTPMLCMTFTNTNFITIPSSGAASPYPSSISVSGLGGTVTKITVKLNNLSHTFPDDIDIMLVGPGGQNAIILSDVGGTSAASGVTLILDDSAATALPDGGPLVSGTFMPTNIGTGDTFAAPAPTPSGGSALSVFSGTAPNGTWSLYVVDDAGGDDGSIAGGWELSVSATSCSGPTPTPTSTPSPTPTATASCLSYNYTIGSGSIVPGTVDSGNHVDDGSTVIALPFSYMLYDQTFTSVAVGSNGHLTFGAVNNDFGVTCLPLATATYAIAPYWADQCTGLCGTDAGTNLGIFTSVTGSSPNRIFNIEWRTAYYNSGQTTNIPINYEVRLYEGQTAFDVVYGSVSTFAGDSAVTVGAQKSALSSQFTSVGCDITNGLNPPVSAGQLYHYTLGACPTPTPTPASGVHITGTVYYCSNSASEPASNVTLTATGGIGGSAVTDSSGSYNLSVGAGGSYLVSPSKTALAPGTGGSGINTIDVVATQRHFLNITVIPAGCRRTAADVNGDAAVNTIDVVAIQRFFIGQTAGSANVGKYQFSPANRTYSGIGGNQSGQDFNALVLGDVVSPFVERPNGSVPDAPDDNVGGDIARPKVATVALPDVASERSRAVEVTTSRINATDNLVGFQGDFTFDSNALTFENEPVQKAGLTAGNWNVIGNVLPGSGSIRTLRVSGYSTDFMPLSGSGTLFELKISEVSNAEKSIQLIWAAPPDDFFFIDGNLNIQRPDLALPAAPTYRTSP